MRPTIDQIRAIGNVSALYRWNVEFVTFPAAIAAPPRSSDLNLRCESTDLPKMTGQSIELNIRGHKVKQTGIYTYSNVITMTFLETVDSIIHNFLKNWREVCWETGTGVQASKADAEALILIQRLDQQDTAIWEYKLIGSFLEDYEDGGTLDGVTSEGLKPSFTLSYDLFKDQPL